MATTNDIRANFLGFFARHGHQVVPSSPLVPRNDPTLLFANSGMVQFKTLFTGDETRAYKRATTSQKCVRAGGKHNDLENVGYTARHHTFFEMLGNFSFGDYFKELAIDLAWTLITKEFGLPAERLLVTVYHDDDEAASLWRRIAGLGDDRVIRIASSDNFWTMGPVGPCGPCSEIFYDHGPGIAGGPPGSPDEDGDRFIEIWNLVFMQFEQVSAEERRPLPKPSIDTGMGLERVAAVLQGKHDNYDTDLMRTLIEASAQATGTDPDGPGKTSHRVIADHLRASAFLMADGVTPSNEGRGYVLRRIMRRAMRHAHLLGAHDPVMWRLVPALIGQMGAAFPELGRAEALITETLRLEESRFKGTLDRGLRLLAEETARLADAAPLPGAVAFRLYDTFGFPLDLTQDVLRGQGRSVDLAGFEQAMEDQRAEARRHWAGSGEAATGRLWLDLRDRLGATEFLGYDTEEAEGTVLALIVDGAETTSAGPGTTVALVVNQTPFYAESGGQVGDTGTVTGTGGGRARITDTKKLAGDLWVHQGVVEGAVLAVGEAVILSVDTDRRDRIRANHSATHLVHAALRERLGDHVTQRGSLVAPDRLRFDISQPRPLTDGELLAVEQDVNARIRENDQVTTVLMSPEDAVAQGAMALFGEKYGESVRVVGMGRAGNRRYSLELCGGTHVRRTGDIGMLRIVGESAVAAGIRRIEAVTGPAAQDHAVGQTTLLQQMAVTLKAPVDELPQRVAALVEDRRRLERELAEMRKRLAEGGVGAGPEVRTVNGLRVALTVVGDTPPRELKPMADSLKAKLGSGVVALVSTLDGKASLVVGVTDDLTDRLDAVALVRAGAEALGGKGGGGRRDMAQAGGPNAAAADQALAAVEQTLAQTVASA